VPELIRDYGYLQSLSLQSLEIPNLLDEEICVHFKKKAGFCKFKLSSDLSRMWQPYDYLAIVPVVEGAGGVMTNWDGQKLRWYPEDGIVICLCIFGNFWRHFWVILLEKIDTLCKLR
jgi:hypothetical protein